MEEIKTKLAESKADVEWNALLPHAKRDALILVDDCLDLLDVGSTVAANNAPRVEEWISQALLSKPSASQLATWNQEPEKKFTTIIVQPFVLVQEVA